MELSELGYNDYFEQKRISKNLAEFDVARVVIENKERYVVFSKSGELEAQITGKLKFTATSRMDFPAVGDWVAITEIDNQQAIIHEIIERKSAISRKMVDSADFQIIAANIDVAFITTSIDHDFNLNRIDRYLTIINSGMIQPIILLTKIDLVTEDELKEKTAIIKNQYKGIPVISLSSFENKGIEQFTSILIGGKTYCFLGSSGVGKSTIINKLIGSALLKTNEISHSTNKGRHTTSHRELIVIMQKCILIDTPGMREVGITTDKSGIENTFPEIIEIAQNCKFQNCTHTYEIECAIKLAIQNNELDFRTFENYQKLEKERIRIETSYEQKRRNDKKFGKMCKEIMKEKKKSKY